MSAFASWLLTALWISILAVAELAVVLTAWHLPRHFPRVVGYLRSAFDDPVWSGKMSMSRTCALIALVDAVWTVRQFVLYIAGDKSTVGIAGVIAGVIGGLTALAASFVLRKKADGSTEPVDDTPKPQTETLRATTTVERQQGGTP